MNINNISKVYDNMSFWYNLLQGKVFDSGRRKTIELMQLTSGEKIIEIGIGTGLSLRYYAQTDLKITGIDLSQKMLKIAQRQIKHYPRLQVDLKRMDGENTSFPDDCFDKVAIMYVYSVTPNPSELLKEALRICKPEGSIYLVNHFSHLDTNGQPKKLSLLEKIVDRFRYIVGFRSDFSYFEHIKNLGVRVEAIDPVNVFSLTRILQIRKKQNLHLIAKKKSSTRKLTPKKNRSRLDRK